MASAVTGINLVVDRDSQTQCESLLPDGDSFVGGGALHVYLTLGFRGWADDDRVAAGGHALSTDDWGRLDVGRGG